MKDTLVILSLLFSFQVHAQENVVIEGKFVHRNDCSQIAPVNAVEGNISSTVKSIKVCAEDVVTLTPNDFTNGATIAAMNDGKTYTIIGTLHEGTLSVSEVAKISE